MGLKPRAFLAGSLGFAVAFVVACGGRYRAALQPAGR